MRRLPVYILIDTSGSMQGEPIEAVKVGLESMISSLRQDPYALESANISIITFDRDVKTVVPLTPLEDLQIPEITTPPSGPTHTGQALHVLCDRLEREIRLSTAGSKGDWMPLLFILTDGKPSDIQEYNIWVEEVKKRKWGCIVACAAGPKGRVEDLKRLTDNVFTIDSLDSASFRQFFRWVSDSIGVGNRSVGSAGDMILPPPPPELNIVV